MAGSEDRLADRVPLVIINVSCFLLFLDCVPVVRIFKYVKSVFGVELDKVEFLNVKTLVFNLLVLLPLPNSLNVFSIELTEPGSDHSVVESDENVAFRTHISHFNRSDSVEKTCRRSHLDFANKRKVDCGLALLSCRLRQAAEENSALVCPN